MFSEEEIKKVEKFRKRSIFFRLLKNIKKLTEKKYETLNIYFFNIKNSFRSFIDNISYQIKRSHLFKLMLTFNYSSNCKIFFSNCKKIIHYKKYQSKKCNFKSKLSRQHHIDYLKKKIWRILNYKNIKKNREENFITNFNSVYSHYLQKLILTQFKAFYRSKFLENKKKQLIITTAFNKLRNYSKLENSKLENDRKIRRFVYMKMLKYAIKKIKRFRFKRKENFKIQFLSFYFYIFKRTINNKIKDKNIKGLRDVKFSKLQTKLFLYRARKILHFQKKNFPKLKKLEMLFVKLKIKIYFHLLKKYYFNFLQIEENKNVSLFKKVYIKKLNLSAKRKNISKEKLQIFSNKPIIKKNKIKEIKTFIKKVKDINNRNRQLKLAIQFSNHNIKSKILFKLHLIISNLIYKKQKYILSLLTFNKNFMKKIFYILKTNRILQNHKKEEYKQISEQRRKIINNYMSKILITKSTDEIKKKEEMIANVYIKRSTRGIKTALIWFKKLKSRMYIKKIYKIKESPIIRKEKPLEIKPVDIINEKSKSLKEDVDVLMLIKNKRRTKPVKIE